MRVLIADDRETAGALAADVIAEVVRARPDAVLGLATGSSPLPVYSALARSAVDFGRITGFALDEYVGVPRSDPQSYASVLSRDFAEPLGVDLANIHVPDGNALDLDAACARYERDIVVAGGVDVQLLGIGRNGHVGFNEPSASLASRTRVEVLAETTRRDNARFFGSIDEVPRRCLTQGLGTILEARSLVLVAYGEPKAAAVARALEGPLSSNCPASVIQLHPEVTVVLDTAAAAQLTLTDYYRDVAALSR